MTCNIWSKIYLPAVQLHTVSSLTQSGTDLQGIKGVCVPAAGKKGLYSHHLIISFLVCSSGMPCQVAWSETWEWAMVGSNS